MKNFLLSILSGLLLALSWPTYGFTPLIFIGFVPLLMLVYKIGQSDSKRKGLKIILFAYLTFLIWNYITTNWLRNSTEIGGWFAVLVNSLLMAVLILMYHKIQKKTNLKTGLVFWITFWIAFEKFHLYWDFSWPWLNLGNVFATSTHWIQWYEYTGSFGGSLWVLTINAMLFSLWINRKEYSRKILVKNSIVVLVFLMVPISISHLIAANYQEKGISVEVIALQPNIDPYNEKYNQNNLDFFHLFSELTKNQVTEKTDFIVAPETFFAKGEQLDKLQKSPLIHRLDDFVAEYPNLNILSGISLIQIFNNPYAGGEQTNQYNSYTWYNDYNSALFVYKDKPFELYHKSKLVVGVETIPYPSVFKFVLGNFMIDLGGTLAVKTTQKNRGIFTSANGQFKVAPIICYESVYGEFVTGYVQNGANFLAIITNDAWWGNTQGHKQHLNYARLRAIETRRSIVRSANTGISAIINQKGEIVSILGYNQKGVLKGRLKTNEKLTFYTQYGDYIARIAIFVSISILFITIFRKKRIF
ncbi:MAG: apolipoprotein N-acyltransferase [Bacteroidetes bacterium HGW-Bacteroidetes-13]|nr:MAG: apolipoprotein N-acyltransferase [Bacteroidetes bacterium HGW-Bacteroidetes-13]